MKRNGHHQHQEPQVDFDWQALLESAGEFEDCTPAEAERFAQALRRLLMFIHTGIRMRPGADRAIGRRVLAVLWVLLPGDLDGVSMSHLAKSIGTTPGKLAAVAGEFSREFGVRSHGQSHAGNWGKENRH